MTKLEERLAAAWSRLPATATAGGIVAGVSVSGARETAAAGVADVDSGRALTTADRLTVASLTKPMVATATVRLWHERDIPLDAPLVDLLPDLAPDWRASRRISLRHLLSHTAGLRADIPPAELEVYGNAPDALAQGARRTIQHGQIYRAGSAWRYCNAGYALAGYALGALEGTDFEDALRFGLFARAGMADSGFDPGGFGPGGSDPGGAVGHRDGKAVRDTYFRARRPAGGLLSTVDDVLSVAEFAMDDAASFSATGVGMASSLMGSRYALGWNLSLGDRVRWHVGDWGGCHSMLIVVPERRLALTVLTNDDAGVRLRWDFAWSELTRYTGIQRPRIVRAVRIATALARGAVARSAGVIVPRTLTS
jgi:D-alanyl-D-alanine carboxypeptidase